MEKREKISGLAFFAGLLFGIGLFALDRQRRKRKWYLEDWGNDIPHGPQKDKERIVSYWNNIYKDYERSFKKLSKDINESV